MLLFRANAFKGGAALRSAAVFGRPAGSPINQALFFDRFTVFSLAVCERLRLSERAS